MAGRITSGPNVADVNDNFSASFVTATDGKPALAVVNTDGTTISGGGGGGGTQYAEGVTTSPATGTVALARYSTSAPTLTNGQLNAPQLDSSGNLKVNVAAGGTSGTQYVELATTLPATGTLALGRYQTSLPTLTNGQMNEPQLDSSSRLLVNIASSSVTNQSTNLTQVAGSAIALGQATASASLPVTVAINDSVLTNTTGVVQAASTTTTTTNTVTTLGASSAVIVLNVSATTGGTITLVINGVTSSNYSYPILQPTVVSTTGVTPYRLGVGLTPSTGLVANEPVPKTLQIVATVVGTITYGIDYELGV